MKNIAILLGFIFFAFSVKAQEQAIPQKGFSVEPLQEPIFSEAQIAAEAVILNNWLLDNVQKLDYEQLKGPREHLYYLIDSKIKHGYGAKKQIWPQQHDPILEMLFSWSEPLGVYGGADVYNAIKKDKSPEQTNRIQLPKEISLTLNGDMFKMASDKGWSFVFPYYFMVGNISDFKPKNSAIRTQLAVVSTGAAKHKKSFGHSQATLVFMYSPDKYEVFDKYWRDMYEFSDNLESKNLDVKNLKSIYFYDKNLNLHKEYTSWSNSSGAFAVIYMGLDGTYEWNRIHFIDFLRSIKTMPKLSEKIGHHLQSTLR